MTNHPASFRLTVLLLMALVHQLGASPCGCLEHNGWYQAFLHDQGHHGQSHQDESAGGHAELCASECDHASPLVAVIDVRVSTGLRSKSLTKSITDQVVLETGLASREAKLFQECDPGNLSAGTLRAHLQVFSL